MGIASFPLDVLSDASVPYRPEEPLHYENMALHLQKRNGK